MRRFAAILFLLGFLFFGGKPARAQYYSWGADAAALRWKHLRTEDVRVVFPDTASALAHRTLYYIQAVRPTITHGFSHPPLKIPFVLHTENFQSNGLVMWMPKRIEFLTTPSVDSYSMPWVKQLVAHEYRHAVQYNNLNRGLIRILSYLIGQQGSTVGLLFMPLWALEGDAVMNETEMSSYGRGRQPRFTIEYRALGYEVLRRRNCDKWFCGSFRDFVPDHYQMGYQMVAYGYDRYGDGIWDKTLRYGVRNAYMLTFSTSVALRKFYGTGEGILFRDAFADLNRFWDSLPKVTDSGRTLTPLPEKNYTTYTHPVSLNDTTLVALKTDFDRPSRLVAVDSRTGRERRRTWTGLVSSRPTTDGQRVWWTEYRRSLLFPERVNSRLVVLAPGKKRPRNAPKLRNVLYPTPIGRSGGLAWVEYTPDGHYTIVAEDSLRQRTAWPMPGFSEVHGLAWDNATERLYTLVTDNSGMWIGRIEPGEGLQAVTRGAYITLSDLRAADGKLYYGKSGFAGEFGHIPFFDNEIICSCGKKGCLETEVSGIAIEQKFGRLISQGVNTILREKYNKHEAIHVDEIIDAAKHDDNLSIELIEEVGEKAGKAVAFLINTFNPEKKIKLATYASRCIENEILMYLRRNSRTRMEVSIDEPLNVDWDGNELLLSDILGTDEDVIYRDLEHEVECKLLVKAINKLNAREKMIICLRFGLNQPDGKEKTQKEVADLLGISQSYISRLEKRIMVRLKKEIVRYE